MHQEHLRVSVGKFVDRFENMLEEVTGARRAIAVVNGTAALHACFTLAGVESGDEVMSPATDVHRDHECDRLLRGESAFH
jgi:dTDP-4-amino-4,6-dideoxygalactose transaminase